MIEITKTIGVLVVMPAAFILTTVSLTFYLLTQGYTVPCILAAVTVPVLGMLSMTMLAD
jgi:hypothetical protein